MQLDPLSSLTEKSFKPKKKDIRYLNKSFVDFKENLIDFAKQYYPQTYRDFNDSSPGMMFIEMASYVGDVLSYYTDYQFKESLMEFAEERKNIISLAKYLGYRVDAASPASTRLEVFQMLPSKQDSNGVMVPDFKYSLTIKEGMQIANANNVIFRTLNPIDFSVDTLHDPLEISVYQRDAFGQPTFFMLRKEVDAVSGVIASTSFNIGDGEQFKKLFLVEPNVLEILNISDSDGNRWYEVDYIAQDLVFAGLENIEVNDGQFHVYRNTIPYILKALRTSRRFISFITPSNQTVIQFGAGVDSDDDEVIIPNLNTVGKGLTQIRENVMYDPSNFLKTKTYGQAPRNTTLTVKYVIGGGIESNVNANELRRISGIEFTGDYSDYNQDELSLVKILQQSLKVNNFIAAVGGRGPETNEEIRHNALATFASQNRAVTKEDYIVRAYSLPPKYGSLAKVHVVPDGDLDITSQRTMQGTLNNGSATVSNIDVHPVSFNSVNVQNNNNFALNMYILSYDNKKKLTYSNPALVFNIRQYLNKYRILTDGINIIDGFIINIGVNFDIIVFKDYSKKEVLVNAIKAVSSFFSIDNMQFCQPINLSRLKLEIGKVEGVQSVANLKIINLTKKNGLDYSEYEYDINQATRNDLIYPSIDPSVFELKFPSKDIRAKVL